MEFKESLLQLSERVKNLHIQISTEEATKNAFIMPFLSLLGYDVFNPTEVVPEFVADIGLKKGEKVDYAILDAGEPIILIECKFWKENLDVHSSQLVRYFQATKAKFGLLTNGIQYRFFTDLVDKNIMDPKPFFEFNILELRDNQFDDIKRFHKNSFNIDQIFNSASELKYLNEMKNLFNKEFQNPSYELIRVLSKQIYPGNISAKVIEQFSIYIKKAFQQYINEIVTDRLKLALKKENEESQSETIESTSDDIVTTAEELEAFHIVKSILWNHIDINRVFPRDVLSYFGVILDNSNRKPICRFHFNATNKYLSFWDESGKEIKVLINSLNEIYNYSEQIINNAKKLL